MQKVLPEGINAYLEAREVKIRQRNPKYRTKTFQAYRYNLEFDDSCIDNPGNLKIKVFKEANRGLVRFILMNRDEDSTIHDYDIVIGPAADENTVTVINSYKEELIATNYADEVIDALIRELEPENLPKQYFLGQVMQFKSFDLRKSEGRFKASSVNINKSIQVISIYLVHHISDEEHCSNEVARKTVKNNDL